MEETGDIYDLLVPENHALLLQLYQAAADGLPLESLIQQAPNVNYRNGDGRTCAMFAAASCNISGLRTLVAAGADLRLQDDQGDTVVHFAVASGCLDTLLAVIELGGPASTPNFRLCTPLHAACEANRFVASNASAWLRVLP
jgi:ankyrin repeat protein